MSAVEYDRYLPEVIGEINNCPEPIAINEIRNTVIDFCKTTLIWRTELDPIPLSINVHTYELDPDNLIRVSGLEWAYMLDSDGEEIRITVTTEDIINTSHKITWRTLTGPPSLIYMVNPREARVAPIPEEAYTLYCGVWIYPSRDSFEAPDFIYDKYLETIAHGAKARILNQRTRPWYDPAAAEQEMNDYLLGRQSATNDGRKSHTRTPMRVRMRPIA